MTTYLDLCQQLALDSSRGVSGYEAEAEPGYSASPLRCRRLLQVGRGRRAQLWALARPQRNHTPAVHPQAEKRQEEDRLFALAAEPAGDFAGVGMASAGG